MVGVAEKNRDGESRSDQIWTWLRARRKPSFTIEDAVKGSGSPETSVRRYIQVLKDQGIVSQLENVERPRDGRSVACYRLAVDQGPRTPDARQVTAKGDERRNKQMPQAVWTAVRIQQNFTWESLFGALNAGTLTFKKNPVQLYLQQVLVRGGFVRATRPVPGGSLNWRYQLIHNPGPLPPVRRQRKIWEPNAKVMIDPSTQESNNA